MPKQAEAKRDGEINIQNCLQVKTYHSMKITNKWRISQESAKIKFPIFTKITNLKKYIHEVQFILQQFWRRRFSKMVPVWDLYGPTLDSPLGIHPEINKLERGLVYLLPVKIHWNLSAFSHKILYTQSLLLWWHKKSIGIHEKLHMTTIFYFSIT